MASSIAAKEVNSLQAQLEYPGPFNHLSAEFIPMLNQPVDQDGDASGFKQTIDSRKLGRFRDLVRHANEHAPYYAKLIKDRNIDVDSCTPGDFPVLTKAILMANYDDIVTDRRITKQVIADFLAESSDPKDRLFNKYVVMHTSGTSGEVGYFVYGGADLRRSFRGMWGNRKALRPSSRPRIFRGLRRIRVAFYGATGGHYAGVTSVARMQSGLARLVVNAESFEVNCPLPTIVDQLNDFKPDYLFGYTTALKILGEQQRLGNLTINPAAISASGEMVTRADIEFLSESFGGIPVSSIYACTEHMMMGYSNPDHETMTLVDSNLIFELYDDHSVVSNLYNYTMPLIRYNMSDILSPISADDAYPVVVKTLVGRCEQMPFFTNASGASDFISPHTINEIFVPGVTRFQMQITGDTSFRFPICVESTLSAEQGLIAANAVDKRLREILQQKGLANVNFDVPIVKDIPVNQQTRKFQLIVTDPDDLQRIHG